MTPVKDEKCMFPLGPEDKMKVVSVVHRLPLLAE